MRMRSMSLFGLATAWFLLAAVPAMAHGPGHGNGAMPGYGPGMMGPGQGPGMMGYGPGGHMMGPGMMGYGRGMMGPGMMGPGMMGPGYGPGMMGPGMMGPGMMGPGHGPGMMGPGMMGPGMMGPGYGPGMMGSGYGPGKPLDTAAVEAIMKAHLAWQGNPRLKLGPVTAKDDDTIVAEVVTVDGSLVARYLVDRRTGAMRFDYGGAGAAPAK